MPWSTTFNAASDDAKGNASVSPGLTGFSSEPFRKVILFRIVINGRGMYYGFFRHACDAIADALDHGANSVAVARA
ncbi:hypothetical protein LMG23994_03633 [Cupriavidus pinatubonensis]|uniref:Uncharacterized protein n=1 Tax=Cupriavidus pinatubonensis TaxID=248026 RepID=A0ABN7Z039_9BURK|nr:hypothetical protein LMG23994_03633 [Cupriavidus pinatubonensis]